MKTYAFKGIPLSKEERYQWDSLVAYNLIQGAMVNRFILEFICPALNLDPKKGTITYNLVKGELYYEENKQPQPQDKPSEGGDKPAA